MIFRNLLFFPLFVFLPSFLTAQSSFIDLFEFGASANYQHIYWESDHDALDELTSSDFGFQAFVLISKDLPSGFSIRSGIELSSFQFSFNETSHNEVILGPSEQGYIETENLIVSSMQGNLFTHYIGLPVNFQYQPLSALPFYLIAGSHFYHKIGHSNGMLQTYREDPQTGDREFLFENEYELPENANTNKISLTAGIGYRFSRSVPVSAEIRVKNSVTPYISGDDRASAWSRGASFAVFYRI